MDFELQGSTKQGALLIERSEHHAQDFLTRADAHDRDGTFPVENFAAMKESKVLAAPIPEQFGGLGVESLHDVMVAVSRLARGCPSTAIAANMHIGTMWAMARMADEVAEVAAMLPVYGTSDIIVCTAGTEAGMSLWAPRTQATPTEGGWLLNGHKIFGTNSEIAGVFFVFCRLGDELANAVVPAGSPGLEVRRTWDSLGMRASCSHEVVLTNCFVPDGMLAPMSPLGTWDALMLKAFIGVNFPLLGAYIGIAESAREVALQAAQRRLERASVHHLIAEIEIDLCAARSSMGRTALAIDEALAAEVSLPKLEAHLKDWQCAKAVAIRAAQHAVDTSMAVAGGASYMSANRLSRLYRDVRAGWFHQPFSPVELYDFVGRQALGLDLYAAL